jgi:hypothetical protein
MISIFAFSQNTSVVSGKIISEATDVEGIVIKNSTSNFEVFSNKMKLEEDFPLLFNFYC